MKPCIKMTTKGLSRKHIIIPMSNDNISSFMKNSSLNVANINRELRKAKTDVLVDYVHSDNMGITIITNKIAQQLDLSIIDHYVKNSNDINTLQVKDSRLPKSKSYLKIIGIPFYPHSNSQLHWMSKPYSSKIIFSTTSPLHPSHKLSRSHQSRIWLSSG